MIFTIRTTVGQEKIVAEVLESKLKKDKQGISSIAVVDGLRGYVLVEASDESEVRKITYRTPHIKGVVSGSVPIAEMEHFFETKPLTTGIERGDIVELTSGAFKGEKAKVIRIDESNDKITVEIIEAAVPIPITVSADSVRMVSKEKAKG